MKFNKYNSLYLSPYSNETRKLAKFLEKEHGVIIQGFIDKEKKTANIILANQLQEKKIEKIFIISPNYDLEIYINLIKYIPSKKIEILKFNQNYYSENIILKKFRNSLNKIQNKIANKIFLFFNIKITPLWTNSLGEFVLENEKLLRQLQVNTLNKKSKYFLFSDKKIVNKTIYNLYKTHYKHSKNIFLFENKFIIKFLKNLIKIYPKLYLSLSQNSNEYELYKKTSSSIKFNKIDIKKGEKELRQMGVIKPYVCIYARDSVYLSDYAKKDTSYHDYRNADIDTYNKMIDYLITKNYHVIRIGNVVNKASSFKNKNFTDYPYTNFVSDFMDIFLISKCEFIVGTTSGLVDLSAVFNKPRIGVNQMPIDHAPYSTNKDIYLPKKLTINNKKISLKQYFKLFNNSEISCWENSSYAKLDIFIEDNNEDEIFKIVKEFVEQNKPSKVALKLQSKYLLIHSGSSNFSEVNSKIGSDFILNNQWFLE